MNAEFGCCMPILRSSLRKLQVSMVLDKGIAHGNVGHSAMYWAFCSVFILLRAVRIRTVLVTRTRDGRPKRSQMGEDRRKWQ